ncbi:hypothetical protein HPB50_018713 [Hyalomma asiaticum]|uniref:Uncharacterized protein n=1 Tax=Hyalomma asiaticum TaxID=266040 RepID=A0ACB7RVG8_HYAAI|nr:hypothetical protein HPB50_018713 [Hyalomma asiaticum]
MLLVMLTWIFASSLFVVFHSINDWLLRRRAPSGKKLPPMPPTSASRGHTEILRADFDRKKYRQWTKEYGPVFRLRLNFTNIVVLNDYDSIKTYCDLKELLRRPPNFLGSCKAYPGILTLNGESWSANRNFCISMLRDVGFAKTPAEDRVMEEAERLVEQFRNTHGKPVDALQYLNLYAFNEIASFFYGTRLPHDHPSRPQLYQALQRANAALKDGFKYTCHPRLLQKLLALIPFTANGRLNKALQEMDAITQQQVELYKTVKSGDKRNDFINHYLLGNINHFFLVGTFNIAMVIHMHLINFAMHHDTLQVRAHCEIDDSVGRDRRPTWEDRKRMPFIQACVWEGFRVHQFTAFEATRECVEDVVVGEYFIPKGTVVYPNKWASNHDPKRWRKPAKFDPSRYMSEDGSIIAPKAEQLATFSLGRRSCPGEMFATVEIFLAITFLLQKYRILLDEALDEDLDLRDIDRLRPNDLKLHFLPRQAGSSS